MPVDVGTIIQNAEMRGLSMSDAASGMLIEATQAIERLNDTKYLDALSRLPATRMPTWVPLALPQMPTLARIELLPLPNQPSRPSISPIDATIDAGIQPNPPTTTVPAITPPTKPSEMRAFDVVPPTIKTDFPLPAPPNLDISISSPSKPSKLTTTLPTRSIDTTFNPGAMPVNPAQSLTPNVTEPIRPSSLRSFDIVPPTIQTDFASRLPSPPTPFNDAPPTLRDAVFPVKPNVQIPVFDGVMPADPAAPPDIDGVLERKYRELSPLMMTALGERVDTWIDKYNPDYRIQLSRLEQRLHDLSSGETETGFRPHVEDAIYSRARSKISAETNRAYREAADLMAGRGFTLPNGALFAAMNQARRAGNDQLAGTGREIVIKQAEMNQQNIQFALGLSADMRKAVLQMSISYHGNLIQLNGQVVNCAQFIVDSAIKTYDMVVRVFSMKLDAYRAKVQVYESLLRATTTTIDIYKAEIEAEKAKIDVDVARIQAFRERVNVYQVQVGAYQTQIQAIVTTAEIEKLKIAAFESQVRAYSAEVQAKQGEWSAYSAAWNGEEAKIKAFIAQNQIYQSELDAYKVRVQAESSRIEAELKTKEAELRGYTAEIDAKRAEWQGYTAEWGGEEIKVRAHQAQVDAYGKAVQAAVNSAELEKIKIASFDAQARAFGSEVDAKKAEWQAFSAAWGGEEAKVRAHLAVSQNYQQQIEAYKTRLNAESVRVEAQSKAVDSQLRAYSTELQAFGESIRAGNQYVAAQATVQDAQLKAHQIQSQAAIEQAKTNAERFKAEVHAELEHKRLLMQGLLEQARLFVKSMESIAQVHSSVGNSYANMAGSALSGMNTLVTAEMQ